jgi:hypothetical protein
MVDPRLLQALRCGLENHDLAELVRAVKAADGTGLSQEDVYETTMTLLLEGRLSPQFPEEQDELLLDLLDLQTGWCGHSARLYSSTLSRDVEKAIVERIEKRLQGPT